MTNTNTQTTALPSYRITNWRAYNQALTTRGSLTIWVSPDVLAAWQAPRVPGRNGRPCAFSDEAIRLLGILRETYHLPLRQTIGFAASIFQLLGVSLDLPDFSTLSRRLQAVSIPLVPCRPGTQALVVLIDSTGVKVSGEGAWKIRMHGKAHATKWRKLHLATDGASGEVLALTVTDAPVNDSSQVPALLQAIPDDLAAVLADTAYDAQSCWTAIEARQARAVIPPNRRAVVHPDKPDRATRNAVITTMAKTSRADWKVTSGYHQRSRIEATMWRYKACFTDRLQARTDAAQLAQVQFRSYILNRFLELGRPQFVWAA